MKAFIFNDHFHNPRELHLISISVIVFEFVTKKSCQV